MTINVTLNPKVRNAVVEAVAILGIANAALPQLAATTHVPAWVGVVVAFLVNVGNQILKDNTPKPPISNSTPTT